MYGLIDLDLVPRWMTIKPVCLSYIAPPKYGLKFKFSRRSVDASSQRRPPILIILLSQSLVGYPPSYVDPSFVIMDGMRPLYVQSLTVTPNILECRHKICRDAESPWATVGKSNVANIGI